MQVDPFLQAVGLIDRGLLAFRPPGLSWENATKTRCSAARPPLPADLEPPKRSELELGG